MKATFLIERNEEGGAVIYPKSGVVKKDTYFETDDYAVVIEVWNDLGYITLKSSSIGGDDLIEIPIDVKQLIEVSKLIAKIEYENH